MPAPIAADYTVEELTKKLYDAACAGDISATKALLNRDKKNKPNVNAGHGFRHLTPLHAACANSHELVAASLVDAKAEINALDASNMTPLHYAVAAGSIRTVEMLLSRGADVGAVDKFMRTPLLTAIEMAHGHEGRAAQICMALAGKGAILNPKPPTAAPLSHAIVHSRDGMLVQKLCDLGADPSAADLAGTTPVYNALAMGKHRALQLLLRSGGTVRLQGPHSDGVGAGVTCAHLAALQGDRLAIEIIAKESKEDRVLGAADADGRTPLHYAAAMGHTGAASLLLGSGQVHVDCMDAMGCTPLVYALAAGRDGVVDVLLAKGASTRIVDRFGNVALAAACASGRLPLIEEVLHATPMADMVDKRGRSPMHVAAERGFVDVLEALAEKGADPLLSDEEGRTPAHVAAAAGQAGACGLLMDLMNAKGSDPLTVVDCMGRTLLHAAVLASWAEVAAVLLDVGFETAIGTIDLDRMTPLLCAAMAGDADCVALLLDCKGVEVDHRDFAGRTALMLAAAGAHVGCVKVLLEAGAAPEATDAKGWAALHHAALSGSAQCCGVLVEAGRFGADIAAGKSKLTPLHVAASKGQVVAALALIRLGASPVAKDAKDRTPVEVAAMAGHKACAKAMEDEAASRKGGQAA